MDKADLCPTGIESHTTKWTSVHVPMNIGSWGDEHRFVFQACSVWGSVARLRSPTSGLRIAYQPPTNGLLIQLRRWDSRLQSVYRPTAIRTVNDRQPFTASWVWHNQTGSLVPPNWEFGTAKLGERITVGLYFDYTTIILRPSFGPTFSIPPFPFVCLLSCCFPFCLRF